MNLKSILVVEDDPSILENLVQVFELENYPVLRAKNGQEAIDILQASEFLPGLICLDLMMPVMNGQAFLTQIQHNKENARFRDIPVLIISAAQIELFGTIVGRIKKPPGIDHLLDFAEKYCSPAQLKIELRDAPGGKFGKPNV